MAVRAETEDSVDIASFTGDIFFLDGLLFKIGISLK